jgi:hypothetical protein
MLVGQWSDFGKFSHPCEWVHDRVNSLDGSAGSIEGVSALVRRLYPHVLFQQTQVASAVTALIDSRSVSLEGRPFSEALFRALGTAHDNASTKPIREILTRDYFRLDPSSSTPPQPSHPMRAIEDAFCQSIEQGRGASQSAGISTLEELFLDTFEKSEQEWDLLGRESVGAHSAVALIRKTASIFVKRSFGIRNAEYSLKELLLEYEGSLRNVERLTAIRMALQPFMGDVGARFSMVEVLGQPTAEQQPLVGLKTEQPGIRANPAPSATAEAPGHDVPCIEVTDPTYRIPLTFEFFMALQLRKEGCAGSSLPTSVRAALYRVRHRYAGAKCRSKDQFSDGRTSIVLSTGHSISLPAPGLPPAIVAITK